MQLKFLYLLNILKELILRGNQVFALARLYSFLVLGDPMQLILHRLARQDDEVQRTLVSHLQVQLLI